MRTTLRLDDDIHDAVRSLAIHGGRSVGKVVSDLLRKALAPRSRRTSRRGHRFPTFDVPKGAPPITPEMVARALAP